MKAIQTRYKGYAFRSRLEARWAVFFDTLGLQWEYEPEGFDLGNGIWYLPDFKVLYPGGGPFEERWHWFEVKPSLSLITPQEWAKLISFHNEAGLTILDGSPAPRTYLSVDMVFAPFSGESKVEKLHPPTAAMLATAEKTTRHGAALWSGKERLWTSDDHTNVFCAAGEESSIGDEARSQIENAVAAARGHRFGNGGRA